MWLHVKCTIVEGDLPGAYLCIFCCNRWIYSIAYECVKQQFYALSVFMHMLETNCKDDVRGCIPAMMYESVPTQLMYE